MSTVGNKKSGKKPVKKLALWGEPEKKLFILFCINLYHKLFVVDDKAFVNAFAY